MSFFYFLVVVDTSMRLTPKGHEPLLGAVRVRRAVVAARPRVYLYQYPDLED